MIECVYRKLNAMSMGQILFLRASQWIQSIFEELKRSDYWPNNVLTKLSRYICSWKMQTIAVCIELSVESYAIAPTGPNTEISPQRLQLFFPSLYTYSSVWMTYRQLNLLLYISNNLSCLHLMSVIHSFVYIMHVSFRRWKSVGARLGRRVRMD